MNHAELEARILGIVEAVLSKHSVEDSRVELKADWPDPEKAARRIAGHANASRGEWILWIIGLDEGAGSVKPTEKNEFANWWPRTKTFFEGISPDVQNLAVQTPKGMVVALLFSTERIPFVVKNPIYGQQNGGPVSYEVPWREATSIRSARRADLISILVPQSRLPQLELLSVNATLDLSSDSLYGQYKRGQFKLYLHLYMIPSGDDSLVIPFHRSSVELFYVGMSNPLKLNWVEFVPDFSLEGSQHFIGGRKVSRSPNAELSKSEIVLHGPTRVTLQASGDIQDDNLQNIAEIELRCEALPVHATQKLAFQLSLRRPSEVGENQIVFREVINATGFETV
jgi:hypothetical protein